MAGFWNFFLFYGLLFVLILQLFVSVLTETQLQPGAALKHKNFLVRLVQNLVQVMDGDK